MKSRLGAGIALALLSAVLVAVTGAPSSAAGASAGLSSSHPFVGEFVNVAGKVAPAGRRVYLQVPNGKRWRNVQSTTSKRDGRYAFTVRAAAATQRYRVYAPSAKGRGPASSGAVSLRGTAAALAFGPPVHDRVGTAQAGAVAMLDPVRAGTTVQLQKQTSSGWSYVTAAKQSSTGIARFPRVSAGTASSPVVYRAVALPGHGAAPVYSAAAPSMQLSFTAFQDEFGGSRLDTSKWVVRDQGYQPGRICSRAVPGLVAVSGGVATLRLSKQANKSKACPYGRWYNPMIGTKNRLAKPYGYYAARVKFGPGRGMHGAFWLQGNGAGGSEIDVAESFGDYRVVNNFVHRNVQGTLHSIGGDRRLAPRIMGGRPQSAAYHVYSVQWSPAGYVFRIDGVPTMATSQLISTADSQIILSMLTSDWELPKLTWAGSTMKVDWVRAWQ